MSRRAAVDVGTNSTRLLVVDADGEPLLREMRITRLGKDVDERGRLDDDALRRTLETIDRYRDLWRRKGVDESHVRIAATSAVRDAADRDRFFDGVREATGVQAEVLSGDEEAALSFLGASKAVRAPRPLAVMDIGGGSTELIVGGGDDEVVAAYSMQLGSVRLTERILRGDPPEPREVEHARREVRERLDEADAVLAEGGADVRSVTTLVAVAGTPTTLAALHLGLEVYEPDAIHATTVPTEAIAELTDRLLGLPTVERASLGPIQSGREDVIAGGALILATVLHRYGFGSVVVSESDILDGLAATAA